VVWRKGKTLRNWGTYWELEGNIVQTHWETGKHEKKTLPRPQNKKGKKARHLECMLGPYHRLHESKMYSYLLTISFILSKQGWKFPPYWVEWHLL
jgi:hypothetical protein